MLVQHAWATECVMSQFNGIKNLGDAGLRER